MSWNYRVMKRDHVVGYKDEKHYSEYYIAEVYYEDETPRWYSDEVFPFGESLEELKEDLERMQKAFDKPTLKEW